MTLTAVVLAGDRGRDPVAHAASVACKALTPVGGRPMVLRVIDALRASRHVGEVLLCGPAWSGVRSSPTLRALVEAGDVRWAEARGTPCTSVLAALDALPVEQPVLVTTADHALLETRIVDHFCAAARGTEADLAVGVARREKVAESFPDMRRTAFRLRDGAFCGCNLFAFLTGRGRAAAEVWRRVEASRKRPLAVARLLSWRLLLRYVTRSLTLESGVAAVSRRMGLAVRPVVLPFAEAAVDVDTVDDWVRVRARLGES